MSLSIMPTESQYHDSVIIRQEISEIHELLSHDEIKKKEIIIRAAEKLALEKYHGNETVIASRLENIFCKDRAIKDGKGNQTGMQYAVISKAYIYNVLPEQYKRQRKTTKVDNTPIDLFEEFLVRAEDICKDISGILRDNLKTVQTLRNSKEQADIDLYYDIKSDWEDLVKHDNLLEVLERMKKELSTIRQPEQLVEFLKYVEAEVISLKKLIDKRQKFSTATKILLKMVFMFRSHDYVAKNLTGKRYGGKWFSAIEKDADLNRFTSMIKCPNCDFNFERWLEKARECERMGLDIPAIDDQFCQGEVV